MITFVLILSVVLLLRSFLPSCSSDQKDPFNRCPLTLEMVQKHVELKERIQQWLADVEAQKKS